MKYDGKFLTQALLHNIQHESDNKQHVNQPTKLHINEEMIHSLNLLMLEFQNVFS